MIPDWQSCSVEEACVSFGTSEKLLDELRDRLQDWLKLQPHLPQDVPKTLLDNLILGTKMSLEQAKHKLDMFYTIKRLIPELHGRDPRELRMTDSHAMINVVYLPKLTPEKYRVCICRPYVNEYSKLDAFAAARFILMIEDILMHDPEAHSLGYVFIFDHASVSLGLFAKYTPAVLKKYEVTISNAYARRVKAVHIVNPASITETLLSLAKRVVTPKLASRFHVHSRGNYESLHRHLPKSMLPKDYDGEGPSINHLAALWRQKVDEKRDWLLEQEKIMVNEQLRPGPAFDGDELFGFSGSFRKLQVD